MEQTPTVSPNHKLILHFDINKTIIMKDSVKFRGSLERTLIILVCSSAWGLFNPSHKTWTLATTKLYHQLDPGEHLLELPQNQKDDQIGYGQPRIDNCELLNEEMKEEFSQGKLEMISFKQFMLRVHPFITGEDIEDYEERKKKSIENRELRGKLLDNFIADENSYGWKLRPIYDDLMDHMRVKEILPEDHPLGKYLVEFYSIVPSFFHLHNELMKRKSDDPKFDFQIIFRTFGVDHEAVNTEFKEFLKGAHPIFENPYPVEITQKDEHTHYGKIFRSHEVQKDIVLIIGILPCKFQKETLDKLRHIIFESNPIEKITSDVLSYLEETSYRGYHKESLQILKGTGRIQEFLETNNELFLCIQDDYEAWEFNDLSSQFSKPLILPKIQETSKNDETEENKEIGEIGETQIFSQIFLDDHCSPGKKCIINVIDENTGESLAYEDHINKYTAKANSLDAIHDEEYFIKVVKYLYKY